MLCELFIEGYCIQECVHIYVSSNYDGTASSLVGGRVWDIHVHIYLVPVNLFIQVHEMLDLDPASWAALVAQLVRASVRSAECRGFKSHLRQLIFSFFICLRCLTFFLSFFLSFFSSQIITRLLHLIPTLLQAPPHM